MNSWLAALEIVARRYGWRCERDPMPLLWFTYSIPRIITLRVRAIRYRRELSQAWKARFHHEIKEHLVVETLTALGSAIGAGVASSEFLGKPLLGALMGGGCAIIALVIGQAVVAAFTVRRSIRQVRDRVQDRFYRLIEFESQFISQTSLNPNHNRIMYEQRDRHARNYIREVDGFLARYFPHDQINLTRTLLNVRPPSFTDSEARVKHIALCDAVMERGRKHLAAIRASQRTPKPTPFGLIA